MHESLISTKKSILDTAQYKGNTVEDVIIEVEHVDGLGWRQKGCMDSDESESDESDYTESQYD